MRLDVVLGNPPYQDDSIGQSKNYTPPIYHKFIDSAYLIGERVILITPGRFLFNVGGTPKKWNRKMLKNENLKVVDYMHTSSEVFSNTDIKGGLCIIYYSAKEKFELIGTFIPFLELREVLSKVTANKRMESINTIMYSPEVYKLTEVLHQDYPNAESMLSKGHKYDLKSNIFERLSTVFYKDKPNDGQDYVRVFGRLRKEGRTYRWINKKYLSQPSNFDKWKVFLPQANGSGALGEVLSTPLIGQPLIGHTQTFLSIGAFELKEEAEHCKKYIKTKFSRALLGVLKVTQNNPLSTWKYVPLQDFTENSDIDWSKSIPEIDQQLYKKYGLNEEEIEFIETHVKEME